MPWISNARAEQAISAAILDAEWKKAAEALEKYRIPINVFSNWLSYTYESRSAEGLGRIFNYVCDELKVRGEVSKLYSDGKWNGLIDRMLTWCIGLDMMSQWLEEDGRRISPKFEKLYWCRKEESARRITMVLGGNHAACPIIISKRSNKH